MRALDVRHTDELSYDEFVRRYMAPNLPVVIRVRTIYPKTLRTQEPACPLSSGRGPSTLKP